MTDSASARSANVALLWSFARPHLPVLLIGAVLGLGASAAALATPLATKWVLDSLGVADSLVQPVALLLGLLAIGAVTGFAQWVLLGRLSENIVLDARTSLIERFFRARLGQIQRFRTGELVTRVTSDPELLAATASIVQIVNGSIALVGTIVLMAVLDLPLVLGTLAAIAVVGVLLALLMPLIGKAERRAQDALGQLGGVLEGGLRALRTVKSSRAEAREIERVVDRARESARFNIRSVWITATAWTIAGSGIQLAIIAILGIGAWRVGSGDLAVSTLVAFLLYAFNIMEPISSLTEAFTSLQSGLAAAARIRETAALEPEDVERGGAVDPGASGAEVLSLAAVSARYDGSDRRALDGVSLDIARRGHTAIVGPSGAGKTTVFSLLLRFIDPESGGITMDGAPYPGLSIDGVRSRIAYVEQETPIVPGTVRENILFRSAEASEEEAWAALRAVRLAETIRALPEGLDTDVQATSLSGGERQRLALARAIVRPSDILLLDEATAQLDGVTEAAIHEVIADVARNAAVVTIAHRLSTVIDADRIIVLDDGRVRASGTHDELLAADELYRELIAALRIGTGERDPLIA